MASNSRYPNGFSEVPTAAGTVQKYIQDLRSQLGRLPDDFNVVKSMLEGLLTENIADDRKQLLENTIKWACSYPAGSPTANILTNAMLSNLWTNLQHPPLSYMGDTWRYRTADGSHNNVLYPDLGKAGSYYARSVVPKRTPIAALPDPGDIFDALFARKGPAKEHPSKISTMLITLATIIIHDIFRTDDVDPNKVASSSYLDLGPLYGHNQAMQNSVRTFKDGKLKPDTFAEPRILGQPPAVAALLVSFNRFHNYVVTQLAEINEGGRFTASRLDKAKGLDGEKAEAKRDNDLFQTGRLITCGLYVNIVLHDYVRVILNLHRSSTTWTLDPRTDSFNVFDADGIPKAMGNQVSMEFNLLYRWHAAISNKNEAWVNDFMRQLWPGQDPESLTQAQLYEGFKRWGHSLDSDPGKWTFGGLKRNGGGGFDDAGLVSILSSATEDIAGAFGARNVPTALRAIEILGINQGRNWGTASLNEVRRFFKLKPHATFLDINPDPDVAASLEALYQEPDNVELYPGLVCEDTKKVEEPGSGLCAGLTVAKAILSDAVALVRGDRYYTVDYSPANLTSFGYNETASDVNVAFGTTIYKLFQRAYPGWYRSNSVYALFPMTLPSENKAIFAARGIQDQFGYERPSYIPSPVSVTHWAAVSTILRDPKTFEVVWARRLGQLVEVDLKGWHSNQGKCEGALSETVKNLDRVADFYSTVTTNLVQTKSLKLRDRRQIDIVRDVIIPSHTIAAAHIWGVPLKGPEKAETTGLTPAELYEAVANISSHLFLGADTAQSLYTQGLARKAAVTLKTVISASNAGTIAGKVVHLKNSIFRLLADDGESLPDFSPDLVQRLCHSGMPIDQVIGAVVPSLAGELSSLIQSITSLLDFYLQEQNAGHWAAIQALAASDSKEAFGKLRKYALEGLRLNPGVEGALRKVTIPTAIKDGETSISLPTGVLTFANFRAAGLDPTAFPEPHKVKFDRPAGSYIHHGYGGHASMGQEVFITIIATQLRIIARLGNLRRAAGPAGQIKLTLGSGHSKMFMTEDWARWTTLPSTWRLFYD